MGSVQVNFGDILPETSENSAFWDMSVDSHLKWLVLFRSKEAGELGQHQSTSGLDCRWTNMVHLAMILRWYKKVHLNVSQSMIVCSI